MLAALDSALRSVPMLNTLGIRVEEARTGHLVLRLPVSRAITTHVGAIHSAAVFAVGEVTAAVVLGTHPQLTPLVHLQKSSKVKYFLPSHQDVTAHAEVTPEMLDAIEASLGGRGAEIEVPVKVLDGHGRDIAELISRFSFRRR